MVSAEDSPDSWGRRDEWLTQVREQRQRETAAAAAAAAAARGEASDVMDGGGAATEEADGRTLTIARKLGLLTAIGAVLGAWLWDQI